MNLDFVAIIWRVDDAIGNEGDEKYKENDGWGHCLGDTKNLTTSAQRHHWRQYVYGHLDEISVDQRVNAFMKDLIECAQLMYRHAPA